MPDFTLEKLVRFELDSRNVTILRGLTHRVKDGRSAHHRLVAMRGVEAIDLLLEKVVSLNLFHIRGAQ